MKDIGITYPQKITSIEYVESDYKGGDKTFDKLCLFLEFQKVEFFPLCDTDEIEIKVSNLENSIQRSSDSFFNTLIGKEIFIDWKCTNSKGYFDLFILGIESIKPKVCILSEGSGLKIISI